MMLNETVLLKYFWVDVVNTSCYVMNHVLIRPIIKLVSYELFKGRKPKYLSPLYFQMKCFVLNNRKDNLGKFDPKVDEGLFLGYTTYNNSFRIFNKQTLIIENLVQNNFDETIPKCVDIKVFEYAIILKKTLLKDKDRDKNQSKNKYKIEIKIMN